MMDLITALIIAMYIAGKFGSNVAQDLAWKARSEDPPSYRREQERWQRKQTKRAAGDGPGRKLLTNAWRDACASADERRARIAERAAERRRAKWENADVDKAEDEAREVNERVAPVEPVWPCGGGCGRTLTNADVAGYALSGDPLCRECRTAPAGPSQQVPEQSTGKGSDARRLCHGCGRRFDPASLKIADCHSCPGDTGTGVYVCAGCLQATSDGWETADRAWEAGERGTATGGNRTPEEETPTTYQPRQQPDPDPANFEGEQTPATGGTVTDLNQWRTKGTTPPITKEDLVSGETTNLSAALNYTQDMANQCAAGAASTETSIATMQAADVSGDVINQLAQAQEALNQAMAAFNAAHSDLERHITVKEAYAANQDAGDKQFVTQE